MVRKTSNNNKSRGKQIASLEQEIHRMKLGSKRKKNKRNTPGGMMARISGGGPQVISRAFDGTCVIRYSERWTAIASMGEGAKTVNYFSPGGSGMPWLDSFGRMFDQYKVRRVRVSYKPAVGTTTGGFLVMGVDYDPREVPTTAGVSILAPRVAGPVWQEMNLTVDPTRAQKARWMYCSSSPSNPVPGSMSDIMQTAFAIVTDLDMTVTATAGSLWCEYEVEFTGPQENETDASALGLESVATVDVNGAGLPTIGAQHTVALRDYGIQELSGGVMAPSTGSPGPMVSITAPYDDALDGPGLLNRLYRVTMSMAAGQASTGFSTNNPLDSLLQAFNPLWQVVHTMTPLGAYEPYTQAWEAVGTFSRDALKALGAFVFDYPVKLNDLVYDAGVGVSFNMVPMVANFLGADTSRFGMVSMVEKQIESGSVVSRYRYHPILAKRLGLEPKAEPPLRPGLAHLQLHEHTRARECQVLSA
jgi:hypothetical protein